MPRFAPCFAHPLLAVLIGLACPDTASAVTIEELAGAKIDAVVNLDQHVQFQAREWRQVGTQHFRFSIGAGGEISGSFTRSGSNPRGERMSQTTAIKAAIGKPGQSNVAGEGHRVWILDGDKLTLLRAFAAGGIKIEITFAGSGSGMTCSARAAFAREEGAGRPRFKGIGGGQIEMLSATQTSSTCRVSR